MSKALTNFLSQLTNEQKYSSEFALGVGVLLGNKVVFKKSFGAKYKYYDLASLTKAIFTSMYCHKNFNFRAPVSKCLPWAHFSRLKIKDLLTHQSGLPAHKEWHFKGDNFKRLLREELHQIQRAGSKPVYSDLGYLLLGEVIQTYENKPLLEVYQEFAQQMKYPKGIHFNWKNKPLYKKSFYAPTENCGWRKRVLQGEVFDDNASALQGVAPQAGLFGDLASMVDFGKILRQEVLKNPMHFKKQAPGWSYGFMMPSGEGSTAGQFFSKYAVGHLGFTGTSFWYDPKVDLYVVILSNRTYPDRASKGFNKVRSRIQDRVYQEFVK